jgi:hypothetical protein
MKKLSMLALLAGGLFMTAGCETPGLTTQERFQRIGRDVTYDYEQINDDVDHFLLLRPLTHLSEWDLE